MKSIAEYLEVVAPSFEGSTVKIILIMYGEAIIEEVFEINSFVFSIEPSCFIIALKTPFPLVPNKISSFEAEAEMMSLFVLKPTSLSYEGRSATFPEESFLPVQKATIVFMFSVSSVSVPLTIFFAVNFPSKLS